MNKQAAGFETVIKYIKDIDPIYIGLGIACFCGVLLAALIGGLVGGIKLAFISLLIAILICGMIAGLVISAEF